MRTPATSGAWLGTIGALPEDYPNSAWEIYDGGGAASLEDGILTITTTLARRLYRRKLFDSDQDDTVRATDTIDVQASVRVVHEVGPTAGLLITDGYRMCGISVGAQVQMVNVGTGAVVYTFEVPSPFSVGGVIRVLKEGTSGWTVWVNGRLIGTVPYHYAPLRAAGTGAPAVGFGHPSAGVSGAESRWSEITYAVNTAVAPAWKLEAVRANMPTALLRRWTTRHEALIRTVVAAFEDLTDRATDLAWRAWTAATLTSYRGYASGSQLPGVSNNLEVLGNVARLSVVRQRIRVASASSAGPDGVRGTWGDDGLNFTSETVYAVRARIIVRAINATGAPGNMVGPFLEVAQAYRVQARLQYDSAGYFWNLVVPSTGTAYGSSWRVGVAVPLEHEVELQVIGQDRVLLLVDGTITAEVPYSYFAVVGNTTASHAGYVGRYSTLTQQVEIDLSDIAIERRDSDLNRRPLFQQRLQDRLIAYGGCERNDRLETWLHHRRQVLEARGTQLGILIELARIACTALYTSEDVEPFGWYLDVSHPDITPVYLDVGGTKLTTDYFFGFDAPGMSAQQIATWAAANLLPTSTVESPFYIGVFVHMLTAFSASGLDWSSTYTSAPEVESALNVGDVIQIRKSDGTTPVWATITACGSGALTVRGADLTGYGSTPYVCVRLARA